ncbi:MAG: DNA repair protein RecN, partial [bacterium]|nr:DNA repair protein RecN [bacterium]
KIVLNEVDDVDTLIFDEIDVGIGGKTSDIVGKKMHFLSRSKQIICITHQAQIARYGEKHFYASKEVVQDRTFTRLRDLPDSDRVHEIARMISGDKITETTLQHSRELLSI